MKPTLVVMAAGLGSRYGGLKQVEAIGPDNAAIIDYSVYDSIKSGFGKVVFIIKKENEKLFREIIGKRIEPQIETSYVFQGVDSLPKGFFAPKDRVKPWGTASAILCCKDEVKTNFAVINADDFYGAKAFKALSDFLVKADDSKQNYCMVGYNLMKTLTEFGHVSRGVCDLDNEGYLVDVVEHLKIKKEGDGAVYTLDDNEWLTLANDKTVSMNCWGFTPKIFEELETGFVQFLEKNEGNLSKIEYFLPYAVDLLIKSKKATAQVLKCDEKWYGLTYKEDKDSIVNAIKKLIAEGQYPEKLWR